VYGVTDSLSRRQTSRIGEHDWPLWYTGTTVLIGSPGGGASADDAGCRGRPRRLRRVPNLNTVKNATVLWECTRAGRNGNAAWPHTSSKFYASEYAAKKQSRWMEWTGGARRSSTNLVRRRRGNRAHRTAVSSDQRRGTSARSRRLQRDITIRAETLRRATLVTVGNPTGTSRAKMPCRRTPSPMPVLVSNATHAVIIRGMNHVYLGTGETISCHPIRTVHCRVEG